MDKKIDGLLVSEMLYEELNNYLNTKDKKPVVVDISIGNDFGVLMYSKMKKKKIESETNIGFKSVHFDSISYEELKEYIITLNNDNSITGIMLQLPLPNNLKNHEREILDLIDKNKDVDGLTTNSIGLLGINESNFVPCTALGIQTLLKCYNVSLEGKRIAIINRSNIVGKPLMHLMLKDNAIPIICHSKTLNLSEITNTCDIVVAALNKQEYIDSSYIKEGAIVIDVGVHKNSLGKTVGDVNFDDLYDKVSLITPPTKSVGPMTICMLAYNSAKTVYKEEVDEVLKQGIEKVKNIIKI